MFKINRNTKETTSLKKNETLEYSKLTETLKREQA